MIDLVAHETHFSFFLEKISQTFVKISMDLADSLNGIAFLCMDKRVNVATLVGMVILSQLVDSGSHIFWVC